MKRQASLLLLLFPFLLAAQNNENKTALPETRMVGGSIRNAPTNGDKPKGSPYGQQMFTAAKVQNIEQKLFMRYNIFNDEFEFISSKNDTLVMDKIEDFSTVSFLGANKKYKLTAYTNSKNKLAYGYLIALYEKGAFALYLKENIDFYEEKKAKTSLEKDMPARYSKADDTYFLKNKDKGISEFPDGKKALLKLFPEKKTEIEAFVKDNKISFSDRADMVKIVDFLVTL